MGRDIFVIGGGLSGLYAAQAAALHGADVTLYEKNKIGSKHNCGEMFTEIYNSAPSECKLNKITRFLIHVGGKMFTINIGENSPFIMTDRSLHEKILKERCIYLGVDIKEETKVSEHDTRHMPFVIDASGVSGIIKYKFGMGKAVDYVVNTDSDLTVRSDTAVFSIRDDMKGYSWFFPRGDNLANVGEGVYDYKLNCKLMSPNKKDIVHKGGGLLPIPTMREYCLNMFYHNNHLGRIRVGNNAGLVNPLAGGGEHLAVVSGMLAGELAAKNMENKYYIALNEIVGDEMRFGISFYEFMIKQDLETVKKVISTQLNLDYLILNNSVRKIMKKWITIPDVKEHELDEFVKGDKN